MACRSPAVRRGRHWVVIAALAAGAPVPAAAQRPAAVSVQARMGHVDFHVDSSVVLRIHSLRGALLRSSPEHPPYLDDKHSFILAIDSARIGITPTSLSDLLNHYTFAYRGSPLRKLTVTVEDGHLKQHGLMKGISFTVVGDLTVTPDGELRLHPSSIKAVGIGVGGLMKFFGLSLEKMVNTSGARGVRIEGNDFLLSAAELLPPPKVQGRLVAIEVSDTELVQVFGPRPESEVHPHLPPEPKAPNYMFFRGGVLRFGKLTMTDTDLLIVDAEPRNRFDFFLDHYNEQLVAGYSRNTPDHGLIVTMPDYATLAPGRRLSAPEVR
jgi:hypothetical protein